MGVEIPMDHSAGPRCGRLPFSPHTESAKQIQFGPETFGGCEVWCDRNGSPR